MVEPLLFEPIYKPKIWGGNLIFTHFERTLPGPEPIGESWELADLEHDQSRVRDGAARGQTIGELREKWGRQLLGEVPLFEGRFPLLIKFLDAQQSLSVQVHPNEAMARRLGGNVRIKHEAWYILAARPDGVIWHGLEPGVDARRFREAMLTGQIEGVLRKVAVRAGQCYYLPSGTPHALGAGVLVAEIQTPSDITYRTYDWGRVDPSTGKPRALHLEQAMQCIDFEHPSPPPAQAPRAVTAHSGPAERLVNCESFAIDRVELKAGASVRAAIAEPVVWIVLEGAGQITGPTSDARVAFVRGDVVLLPAALNQVQVQVQVAVTESIIWLEVTVPSPAGR